MTIHTDGAQPSVSPGGDDGSGAEHRKKEDAADDPSPLWLRQEIQRRVAATGSGSDGRHAHPEMAGCPEVAEHPEVGERPEVAEHPEVAERPDTEEHPPQRATTRGGSAPPPATPLGGPSMSAVPLKGRPRLNGSAPGGSAAPPQFDPDPPTTRLTALSGELVRGGVDGTSPPRIQSGPPNPAPARPVAPRPSAPDQPAWYPPAAVLEPRWPDPPSDEEPNVGGSDGAPERVRVVLSERNQTVRTVRTVEVVHDSDSVGELLRNNLIGSQLAVALRFAVVAGVSLGLLPVLFAVFPAIGRTEVLGMRLPWLLLGVLVYPFLFGLGWWHTRTAERIEQNFVEYVRG